MANNNQSGPEKAPNSSSNTSAQMKDLTPFFLKAFDRWYEEEDAAKVHLQAHLLDPKEINWEKYAKEDIPEKAGEYTLNPEMQKFGDKDFEDMVKSGRVEIAKGSNLNMFYVAADIVSNYSKDYYIPGLEFLEWLINNPDKASKEIKENQGYLVCFGSMFRRGGSSIGQWGVPYTKYSEDEMFPYMVSIGTLSDARFKALIIKR